VGLTARAKLPSALRGPAYRAFARATGADLTEAELELGAYPSLGDLFARRLRAGARPIDRAPNALVCPCDGVIAARGICDGGALIQAKGKTYQLSELVVDEAAAAQLDGGDYVTIYLSPRDYHRVHVPVDARIVAYDYVPGSLWPVNPKIANRRERLLSRNERVVIWLHSETLGVFTIVMVGAGGVGNIALAHAPESVTWRMAGERRRIELDGIGSGLGLTRGDELGAFRLGSTVVMVFSPGAVALTGEVGQPVKFGERLGVYRGRS
jgi:phosphatidylserine decarboxylase